MSVPHPGETIRLTIEKPVAGGAMLARADGLVVLVTGAIPGEVVTARVDRLAKGVAHATVVGVEEASPDRREVLTDPLCGGCAYAHVTYARQLDLKARVVADALVRIGRVAWDAPIAVAASPDEGYRMRARLHGRDRRVGFFREGTHRVCDPRQTRQLLPAACDAIESIAHALASLGVAAPFELDVAENVAATERVVHLEPLEEVAASALARAAGGAPISGMTATVSGVGSSAERVLAGDPHVTDVLSVDGRRVALRRHVRSFFQGNRFLLPDLVACVVASIPASARVLDLYAGTGLFSVAAAVIRGALVTAVEGDRRGAADLLANVRDLGGAVEAVHAPVETFLSTRHRPTDALIVDPPRTGMSKVALRGAADIGVSTLIYVSCDAATFARDARLLGDARYRMDHVRAFDLFPNTPHVETVAVFRRE